MLNFRIFIFTTLLLFLVGGLVVWLLQSPEQTLNETCLSLSESIAQAPGIEAGEFDYQTYADLKIPPLSPRQSLEKFELEEGFRIEVVAHEPMVVDPVAMDIDADGRLWVVDMPSYMPVHDMGEWETAAREQVPKGRVIVLEDTNGDGKMDKKRIFREHLILPRSIKVLADGILVAEPPNVWFISDTNGDGKGDRREVVYNRYGDPTSDNVEHMPNGLMWGMDNWLHSVHRNVESIRRVDGRWQTRPFRMLGQWGLTHNNWGQLYSSHNTNPLQTHLVPYGYSERHPLFDVQTGKNRNIAPTQPMWPAHVTGVNRGYRVENEVRKDGTLKQATATAGPVIYRGNQFGEEYSGNAFVPEPAGNLIKRYIIEEDPARIEAEADFAYREREFLTSTDERFRPVNMYNAPDGSLYIIDMYRGLFQHARFLTDHLREYVVENELYKPYGKYGRIYRIVREDREIDYQTPVFSKMRPTEVAGYLQHENGLLRDQAQQVLVQCSPDRIAPMLEEFASGEEFEFYTRLQALWTLEGYSRSIYGYEQLTELALQALDDNHPRIRASAIRILEPAITGNNVNVLNRLEYLTGIESAPFVNLQLLASLGESGDVRVLDLMAEILDKNADSSYFREMIMTGVYQREYRITEILQNGFGWSEELGGGYEYVLSKLAEAAAEQPELDLDHLSDSELKLYIAGGERYQVCMACHGAEGQGMAGVGTSLAGSEWVNNNPENLIRITLHGIEGGAAERGENVPGVMPAHGFMSDEDIAAILTYVRQSWGNSASPITPEEVERIRQETPDRRNTWSPDELREILE